MVNIHNVWRQLVSYWSTIIFNKEKLSIWYIWGISIEIVTLCVLRKLECIAANKKTFWQNIE